MMPSGSFIGVYRIDGLLGVGGMAEVYRVWHDGLSRHEALKVLPPHFHADLMFVRRFVSEARTAARLHHPHIAAILSVSEGGPPFYFAMELVAGPSLAEWMATHRPASLEEALPLLEQIARALDYAHARGVIHRDVKPTNVLLGRDESGAWNAKVVDFGIARAGETEDGTRFTKTGALVGTPEYMSPEQSGSGAPVDGRTDLYSLGIIAYEMLCGVTPFPRLADTPPVAVLIRHVREQPRAPREYSSRMPASVNAAILRALAKNPVHRFSSCSDFVRALRGEIPVGPMPRKDFYAPSSTSNNGLFVAAIALFLTGGTLMIAGGLSHRGSENAAPPVPVATQSVTPTATPETGVVDAPVDENESDDATPAPPSTPGATTSAIPDLSGSIWSGQWGNYSGSRLTIDSWDASSGTFSGTLQAGDDFKIEVSGSIDGTHQITITENTVASLQPNRSAQSWGELSSSQGSFDASWSTLHGGGPGGNGFSWDLRRESGY